MLHTEAVEPGTFSLLKRLMALEALRPFSLVGGTALALRYGHRSSVDLDLFFHERFDYTLLAEELNDTFGDDFEQESGHKQFGLFCYVKKVKVDIVYYPHVPIDYIEVTDSIRMYGSKDICAMKIQAFLVEDGKKISGISRNCCATIHSLK